MTAHSIARLYDTSTAAHAAVRDLEQAGFGHDNVSYMGRSPDDGAGESEPARDSAGRRGGEYRGDTGAATGAGTGATLGTVLGGGAGLLAGLGALAIPGVGPLVAAGWLVAAAAGAGAGAAAGGLLGALAGAGLGEESSATYAEGVRRGGHLVVVRAEEARVGEAEAILDRHHPVDMQARTGDWRKDGWTGADVAGPGAAGTGMPGVAGAGAGAIGGGMGLGAGSAAAAPGLGEDASRPATTAGRGRPVDPV